MPVRFRFVHFVHTSLAYDAAARTADRAFDRLFGRFAWYRRRAGGRWTCWTVEANPETEWDSPSDREIWRRANDTPPRGGVTVSMHEEYPE